MRVGCQRIGVVVAALLLGVPSWGRAQDGGDVVVPKALATSAAPTISLVAEEVRQVDQAQPGEGARFWWSSVAAPAWTPTDQALAEALRTRGVTLTAPSAQARVSKIYAVAKLGVQRASVLGALLGAERVLVGQVTYEVGKPPLPFGLHRCAAQADVSLVQANTSGAGKGRALTVARVVYDPDPAQAQQRARAMLVGALADLTARTMKLQDAAQPVGAPSEDGVEPLLLVQGAPDAVSVEAVQRALLALPAVKAVGLRWAAEGLVALEINPGVRDAPAALDLIVNTLTAQPFEGITAEVVTGHRLGDGVRVLRLRR